MSRDDPEAADVAHLFRLFGGDASTYKEFEPARASESGASVPAPVPPPETTSAPSTAPPAREGSQCLLRRWRKPS